MSKFKSEIRASVLNDMGSRIEDALDAAKRELAGFQGGRQALVLAKQKVEAHMASVDKDVDAGRLDLEQASLVKKYMSQCCHILENLGIQAEVQGYQAQGKIMATENLVKVTKTLFDQERAKLEAAEREEAGELPEHLVGDPEDPRRPVQRPVGVHPGNVIADRKAEAIEQTEVGASETESVEEAAAALPEELTTEEPSKPKGRKKKG